jgi:hypothetical protein
LPDDDSTGLKGVAEVDKRSWKLVIASFVPQGSFAQTASGLPLLLSKEQKKLNSHVFGHGYLSSCRYD